MDFDPAVAPEEPPKFYPLMSKKAAMKVEFKRSKTRSNIELVFINEIFEGEFHSDVAKESFLYVPATGDRILLSSVAHDEAQKLLIGELSRIYS